LTWTKYALIVNSCTRDGGGPVTEQATPEGVSPALFEEIVRLRGFKQIPSFYRGLQPYPRLTAQFWESLKAAMHAGSIDQKTKEMIALGVCIALGTRYCIDSHIAMASDLGLSKDELEEIIMIVNAFVQTTVICSALNPQFDPEEYR